MPHRIAVVSLAALSLVIAQTAQAAADCWNPEQSRAAQIQELNTLLMIESLKCGNTIPDAKANYDAFVTRNRDSIVRSKHMIEGYFVEHTGTAAGETDYLNYETALANEMSSPAATYERCEDMAAFMHLAVTAPDRDLLALAHVLAASRIIEACPTPVRPMAIEVWKKETGAAVAPPGPVSAPLGLAAPDAPAPDTPAPVALVAAAAAEPAGGEPTEVVDGVPTVVPAAEVVADQDRQAPAPVAAAAPDTASALQAAAQALAIAANALKNAAAPAPVIATD